MSQWFDSVLGLMLGRPYTQNLADAYWKQRLIEDSQQFNRDFQKNTGRQIKYGVVRGYDPDYNQYRTNKNITDFINDSYKMAGTAFQEATGIKMSGKTMRNIMDL